MPFKLNPFTGQLDEVGAGGGAVGAVTQVSTDSGSALPAAGIISLLGSGNLSTSGTGSTVTITLTPDFLDSTFRIQDDGDLTKEIAFEASAITTATTRTITMADQDINLTPTTGTFQGSDAGLTSISGLTTAADNMIYTTALDTYAVTSLTAFARTLLDDADAATARTTLGLGTIATQDANAVAITGGSITGITDLVVADGGTGVSAFTAFELLAAGTTATGALQNIAAGTAGHVLTSNGAGVLPSFAAPTAITVVDSTFRIQDDVDNTKEMGFQVANLTTATTRIITMADQDIDLTPTTGTYQASDAGLTSISGLTTGADDMIYTTALDTYAVTSLTAYARTLLDDADAATARTTLGLGTIATQDADTVAITGGSITGITDLAVADGGTGVSVFLPFAPILGGTTANGPLIYVNDVGQTGQSLIFTNLASRPVWGNPVVFNVRDDRFVIQHLFDTSKELNFDVSTITTATTRTITAADQDIDLTPNTGTYQASDAGLTSISGLTTAADTMIYTTALDVYATTSLTAFARTLLDDADAATMRTTLGLGTISTQNANAVAITGGSITGITDLVVADGGTGVSSATAYSVLCGGTTATGAFQSVATVGTSGQVLTSNGASALPTWQDASALVVVDSTFRIEDDVDPTKEMGFQVSGVTTATTRIITMADQDIDLTPSTGTFEAADAGLLSIAGLTTAADTMIYTTALDVYATTSLTAFARTILDDADQATVQATLALTPGTDVQVYDAGLTSIAGLTTAADTMIYTTALDTYATTALTAYARTLLDDADAATARGTLGIGENAIFSWNLVTGTAQTAALNSGYVTDNIALVTVTLPDIAPFGTIIKVSGKGSGGWKVGQNAGESIRFGSLTTTVGTGGSLASTNQNDDVELLCITADTEWKVISSNGTITVT